MRFASLPSILLTCVALPLHAEVPNVVVDTAPLHSLVARVMDGAGTPTLLLPPGTSPHDAALRPSDARSLSEADLVVWTGDALLPWLGESLAALAPEAIDLELLDTDGWTALPLRETAAFATDDHHHAHSDHDEAEIDPHAWLDPEVAAVWMGHVAEELAQIDPEHAALYRENAADAAAADAAMAERIALELAPLAGRGYLVPHDAFQYFERRFGLPATGAVTLSDAAAPGPTRISELRDLVADSGVTCVLTDPLVGEKWTDLLRDGGSAKSATVDPDGTQLAPGPSLYPELVENLASALKTCLG